MIEHFRQEMIRLHDAFGFERGTKLAAEKLNLKIEQWYRLCPSFQNVTISRGVDKAIMEAERIPPFSVVLEYFKAAQAALRFTPLNAKTECDWCGGEGLILAEKEKNRFVFLCHACQNHQGRYNYPVWQFMFHVERGFKPIHHRGEVNHG